MELYELDEELKKLNDKLNVIMAQNQGIVAMLLEVPEIDRKKLSDAYDKRFSLAMRDGFE